MIKSLSTYQTLGLFLVLGFLLYGNTLGHDYTLDDALVITENNFTKEGWSGIWKQMTHDQFVGFYGVKKELVSGGRYRPLSMVVFSIQYALFGANPFIGHLTNVLFYILNGFLLFIVLRQLLPQQNKLLPWLSFPFLVSLLWFFHPIHTEVVANIKGLDELMAFSGELLVLWLILKYLDFKQPLYLLGIFIAFLCALLSKENAITWLALFPLTIYFFKKEHLKSIPTVIGVLMLSSAVWFAIRYKVVGGGISDVADSLMNDPFLESSLSEKYATIVLTLGKYLQLLFFPHPLTYDYYPKHIPIVNWTNTYVILSIITHIYLIYLSIKGIKNRTILGFSILIYGVTLSIASNLIFPIGAFMNERFIYVSSLGFCLFAALFFTRYLPLFTKNKSLQLLLLGTLFLAYGFKTVTRNAVWKNNYTLSTHDAEISVNGAKSQVMAGGVLLEEKSKEAKTEAERLAIIDKSIMHLNRAINIYPEYVDALILMGNAQWERYKSAQNAMPYYFKILSINPYHQNTWNNCYIILEQEKDIDYRIRAYESLLKINPNQMQAYLNLGRAYGQYKNDLNKAIQLIQTAQQLAPNNYEVNRNLGIVYGLSRQFDKSIPVLHKAIELQPNLAINYIDLAISYYNLGQEEKAKLWMDKALQIDPSINRSQYPI